MTTINDIARMADVSKATVSKVINDYPGVNPKTKEKVLEVMRDNNYWPNATARSLSTNRSFTIGIFDPSRLNNFFFREVMEGIESLLGEKGFDILYFTNKNWGDTWVDFSFAEKSLNRNIDGVLMMGFGEVDFSQFNKLIQSKIPTVFIDLMIEGKKTSYVTSDNISGAKKAIKYLYKMGHRDIGIIRGPSGFKPAEDRFKGFRETLTELDITYHPEWVKADDYSEEAGYKKMKELLQLDEKPTAIFCEDIFAVGAIQVLKENKLEVPDDISFIGFDDIELSRHYGLTTIAQDKIKIGRKAAELLLKIIYKEEFSPVIIPTELVERKSCKKICYGN